MSSLLTSCIIFGLILVGAIAGVFLRRKLPERHIGESSRQSVQLVMGLISALTALVLGLLVASAKTSYDTQSAELVQLSAEIIQLDRMLTLYGPDALEARTQFRSAVERLIERVWPSDKAASSNLALPSLANAPADFRFFTLIANLDAQTNAQRFAQSRALDIVADLSRTRVLLHQQSGSSIPVPFLVVLVFWLMIIFMSFGLFARTDATVLSALFVGSLSVAGAVFLILELDRPFDGLMRLSGAPLRSAVAQITP